MLLYVSTSSLVLSLTHNIISIYNINTNCREVTAEVLFVLLYRDVSIKSVCSRSSDSSGPDDVYRSCISIKSVVVAVELVPQRVNRRRSFSTLMLTLGDIVLVRLA